LIGETTYGKNVVSLSLYETNDEKIKWGMQPIVVRFYNSAGSSNYSTGFVPDYTIDEFSDNLRILDFGDVNEKLLNKALTLINGGPLQVRRQTIATVKPANIQRVAHSESFLNKPERNVMIDDVRGEQIKKMMKKYFQ
jgi:C-terminal processing protease CtpA/Prc